MRSAARRLGARRLGAAMVVLCAGAAQAQATRDTLRMPTVVFLVRHADRDTAARLPVLDGCAADDTLLAAGTTRAEALARALRGEGVDRVVTTRCRRTRATAAPLRALLRLPAFAADTSAAKGDTGAFVAAVLRHRGHTILAVTHHEYLAPLLRSLGVSAEDVAAALPDSGGLRHLATRLRELHDPPGDTTRPYLAGLCREDFDYLFRVVIPPARTGAPAEPARLWVTHYGATRRWVPSGATCSP